MIGEVKLFDPKFVHFMWDDELEGKDCFVANNMKDLIFAVENDGRCNVKTNALRYSGNNVEPFYVYMLGANYFYRFAYYDQNYSIKKAFNEGKTIQYQPADEFNWRDVEDEDAFERLLEERRVFRIKPEEEKKWIAYLARRENGDRYLTACREDKWEEVQKDYGAKTKLFVGTENEVAEWYRLREKFTEAIKAWEDGKTIQFYSTTKEEWRDSVDNKPFWDVGVRYRAKSKEKKCRPYESSAEMIVDFIDRFKVNCPQYAEPLIWVKSKADDSRHLVTSFVPNSDDGSYVVLFEYTCGLDELFDNYTYLDGSHVGKEVKE